MVETFITIGMCQAELSTIQYLKVRKHIGDAPLTVGRMIELIYLVDNKAEVRIKHFPTENEYKVSGIMNARPVSRVGVQLHRVLFDILKVLL